MYNQMLPAQWYSIDVAVRYLYLDAFEITGIEEEAFVTKPFEMLIEMTISNMNISIITENTFCGLRNLTKLRFDHVKLEHFIGDVLHTMPKLGTFYITNCGSHELILDGLFSSDLPNLYRVGISDCNLSDRIVASTFSGLRNLHSFTLTSDQITGFAKNSFAAILTRVKMFSLQSNQLKSIDDKMFQTNRRDLKIYLSENQWDCVCKLDDLRKFVQSDLTNVEFDDFKCATPSYRAGHSFKHSTSFCEQLPEPEPEHEPMPELEPLLELESVALPAPNDPGSKDSPDDKNVFIVDLVTDIDDPPKNVGATKPNQPATNQHDYDKIKLRCFKSRKSVHLTPPDDMPLIRDKRGDILTNLKVFSHNSDIIGFESFDGEMPRCMKTPTGGSIDRFNLSDILEPNQTYQFCLRATNSKTIFPLDCATFHLISMDEVMAVALLTESDVWLMRESKASGVLIFILIAFLSIVGGMVIAFLLAKLWPNKVRGKKAIMKIYDTITPTQANAIKRLQYVLFKSVDIFLKCIIFFLSMRIVRINVLLDCLMCRCNDAMSRINFEGQCIRWPAIRRHFVISMRKKIN